MKCEMRLTVTLAVFTLVARCSQAQMENLPNISIPNPDDASNDILGEPISEKEIENSIESVVVTRNSGPEGDLLYQPEFYEGDIIINTKDQLYQMVHGDPQQQASAVKNPRMTWPGGVIPYVISSSFSSLERSVIARAMAEYRAKTCVSFVPRTNSHTDYVHILKGRGCFSAVGRAGGVQVLSLGNNCVYFGIALHEMMHAAGFWHEQSRFDRDTFVTINWANILPGYEYNFRKKSTSSTSDLGLPYDYDSIMHYGPYAFSRSRSAPTIQPRRSGVTIGQRTGLSELDVKGLNLLYRCSGVGPTVTKPTPRPTTCVDSHQHCASWAAGGNCASNRVYMAANCKKSCKLCGKAGCRDVGEHCVSWASKGECQRNPGYMLRQCKKSCKLCGVSATCQDRNTFCQDWAKKRECVTNPAYMRVACPKACGVC
ncbi:zinc metalloproteinase nas-4-like [Panulirus ornatus]|uniref:zinc metalloproteinase nas-4-like n=1 Tax=Panulirus ornatus TaxID=150431 RepID=UPI003A84F860